MALFIDTMFPGRHSIQFGDSTKTLPEYIAKNPKLLCDLIVVDGGHSFATALSDITNSARVANLDHNIIVLDDYPNIKLYSIGLAWEDSVTFRIVGELFRCFLRKSNRGFVVGTVIRHPN